MFKPILISGWPGRATLPCVEATINDLPLAEKPQFWLKSTSIISLVPSIRGFTFNISISSFTYRKNQRARNYLGLNTLKAHQSRKNRTNKQTTKTPRKTSKTSNQTAINQPSLARTTWTIQNHPNPSHS